MEDIWTKCEGSNHLSPMYEVAWRMIEAQHIHATRKLVDSATEQVILEEIIESAKPQFFGKEFAGLHYLLYTPFRYPPLKYGSRFGSRLERSLWYGSIKLTTAMAEKAFYQFNFLRGSHADFGIVEVPLTAFSTPIKTLNGIQLTELPFKSYQKIISSPITYQASQALGTDMRRAAVDAFCYQSARDYENTKNIALFTPRAFLHKKPNASSFQTWQCIINHDTVEFIRSSAIEKDIKTYPLSLFLVDGKLPFPAN